MILYMPRRLCSYSTDDSLRVSCFVLPIGSASALSNFSMEMNAEVSAEVIVKSTVAECGYVLVP